jgi:hypothetical protein
MNITVGNNDIEILKIRHFHSGAKQQQQHHHISLALTSAFAHISSLILIT